MNQHRVLFNGIYDLDKKFKEIDKGYALNFNTKTGHFELWKTFGMHAQKELDFGKQIDHRALLKARVTRIENIAKIMQKMDEMNEKIQENALFEVLDKSKQALKEVVTYADKTSADLSENLIAQIMNG